MGQVDEEEVWRMGIMKVHSLIKIHRGEVLYHEQGKCPAVRRTFPYTLSRVQCPACTKEAASSTSRSGSSG